jgi:hypothetical protein
VAIVNDFELIVRGLAAMLAPFPERDGGRRAWWRAACRMGPADIALFDTFGGTTL